MKICSNCKYVCNDDMLQNCPRCNGELILMENHRDGSDEQGRLNGMYISKEDRMYEDIHTIKNIMVAFMAFVIIAFVFTLITVLG